MKKNQYFLIRISTVFLLLFAISTKSMAMNAGYPTSTFTNRDIVSKLVKSTTFENLSLNLAVIFFAFSMHRELLSESQLKYEDELMKSYSTRLDLTFPEKLEIANIAGFASWEQYKESIELIKELKVKLYLEFPSLRELAPEELQNVLKEAVMQIDVATKLDEKTPLKKCYDQVSKNYVACITKPGFYHTLTRNFTMICLGTVLTVFVGALIAVEVATAGAATVAALAAWYGAIATTTAGCLAAGMAIFGVGAIVSEKQADCLKTLKIETGNCIIKYKP